jgi:hypothetical protein
VHKLVAEHFLPNKGGKPIVNHMDSDRSNHSVDNLEWVDNSENQLHRWKTQKEGLKKMKYDREYGKASKLLKTSREATERQKATLNSIAIATGTPIPYKKKKKEKGLNASDKLGIGITAGAGGLALAAKKKLIKTETANAILDALL